MMELTVETRNKETWADFFDCNKLNHTSGENTHYASANVLLGIAAGWRVSGTLLLTIPVVRWLMLLNHLLLLLLRMNTLWHCRRVCRAHGECISLLLLVRWLRWLLALQFQWLLIGKHLGSKYAYIGLISTQLEKLYYINIAHNTIF